MKKPNLMKERIRRVKSLFKELGFSFFDAEKQGSLYSLAFENNEGFQGEVIIDHRCHFLEISFTFYFSLEMFNFLKQNLEEMLKICYEYGCYIILSSPERDIAFSVFSKLYYSGLNYYSLKQSLKDFKKCIDSLAELLKIDKKNEESG